MNPYGYIRENRISAGIFVFLLISAALTGPALNYLYGGSPDKERENTEWREEVENKTLKKATFAGGCFWCIEAIYEGKRGVDSAVSGYTGGKSSTATYRQVATGGTDHREAVLVKYYPSLISYEELLKSYWTSIDPTDKGGQFSDRGYQYTTAIYAHSTEQYKLAMQSKENLSDSGKFEEPIVTEVLNTTEFYVAEDYHQNYSRRNTAAYEAYERASGRTGYVERTWNK